MEVVRAMMIDRVASLTLQSGRQWLPCETCGMKAHRHGHSKRLEDAQTDALSM
jgi:hypothetical protein